MMRLPDRRAASSRTGLGRALASLAVDQHNATRYAERVALRKLAMLDAAELLEDLRVPPGNRVEALKGDRAGQHSIRINQQWRICSLWTAAGPEGVEIVDYH